MGRSAVAGALAALVTVLVPAAGAQAPPAQERRGPEPVVDIRFDQLEDRDDLFERHGRKLGDYFGGIGKVLGPRWKAETFDLVPDGAFGRVVQMRQIGTDAACPPYCTPNRGASGPTGTFNVTWAEPLNPYWVSRYIQFRPGWTTAGSAYKVFADTYSDRTRIFRAVLKNGNAWSPDYHITGTGTVVWANRSVGFATNVTTVALPVQPGGDDGWWQVVMYYHKTGPAEALAGFWVRRAFTASGTPLPAGGAGQWYGILTRFAGAGHPGGRPLADGIIALRNGENMNAGVTTTQFLRWGPIQVWDGRRDPDPLGLLALAGVR